MTEIFLVNQIHLIKSLQEYQLEVCSFEDEEKVLAELTSRQLNKTPQPEAILCHISEENTSNYEKILELTATLNQQIPVIVLSEIFNLTIRKKVLEQGAADFYSYAFDLEAVVNRIRLLKASKKSNSQGVL